MLGFALATARRRRRAAIAETDIHIVGGFAEAADGDDAYEGPASTVNEQVLEHARTNGCGSARILAVYAGRSGIRVVLSVADGERDLVSAAEADLTKVSVIQREVPAQDRRVDLSWQPPHCAG